MSLYEISQGGNARFPSARYEEGGVHVAAGGHGNRIRRVMDAMHLGADYPKHLLPTGGVDGETLLGRIVRQAMAAPVEGPVVIHANERNAPIFAAHPDIEPGARIDVRPFDNSLGPFVNGVLETGERTLGSAGDFYADFTWEDMLNAHESGRYPVTFMVGRTVAVEGGAVFDVEDSGRISGLRRALRTDESDIINIGAYIFDPHKDVIGALEKVCRQASRERVSEEAIANELISRRLVGSYMIAGAFNVNTPETYRALLDHTAGDTPQTGDWRAAAGESA